jgi:ATP-dependent DNA ligase
LLPEGKEQNCLAAPQQMEWPTGAILVTLMSLQFQPMPLLKRRSPFDDPGWIFELKYDRVRALAMIEHGRAQLLSRNLQVS